MSFLQSIPKLIKSNQTELGMKEAISKGDSVSSTQGGEGSLVGSRPQDLGGKTGSRGGGVMGEGCLPLPMLID